MKMVVLGLVLECAQPPSSPVIDISMPLFVHDNVVCYPLSVMLHIFCSLSLFLMFVVWLCASEKKRKRKEKRKTEKRKTEPCAVREFVGWEKKKRKKEKRKLM